MNSYTAADFWLISPFGHALPFQARKNAIKLNTRSEIVTYGVESVKFCLTLSVTKIFDLHYRSLVNQTAQKVVSHLQDQ